MKNSSNK